MAAVVSIFDITRKPPQTQAHTPRPAVPPTAVGLPADERDYIIPAKDAQGQSVRITCRVSPETARLIAEVFESRKWPFRVQGDLLRFAIVTITAKLAASEGIADSLIAIMRLLQEMSVEQLYQLSFEENFSTLRSVVDKYVKRGAPDKAREFVLRQLLTVRQLPEGYWREQYEAQLYAAFGNLLDGTPHASPLDLTAGDSE